MITRFSAYGFLKNQRYFEPFLVLALLQWGATFWQIGVLIAVREATRNLLEVPSGAAADLWGRRRTMVVAFVVYPVAIASFVLVSAWWSWTVGMVLLGVGDALRSGTHKAIIFGWLASEGRTDEKTKVYGFTRSWSQIGSAVSIPIGVAIVVWTDDYEMAFWATCVPWVLNLVNLASYPRRFDEISAKAKGHGIWGHLRKAWRDVSRNRRLRRLVLDAMAFEGIHKATKDYLQPAVLLAAAVLPAWWALGERGDTAVLVGAAYVVVHVAGAVSSRRAHVVAGRTRGNSLGLISALLVVCLGATLIVGLTVPVFIGLGFAGVAILHNLFRPLLIGSIDDEAGQDHKATVLSLESQAGATTAIFLAPAVGLAADLAATEPGAADGLWAVAALGLVVALPLLIPRPRGGAEPSPPR